MNMILADQIDDTTGHSSRVYSPIVYWQLFWSENWGGHTKVPPVNETMNDQGNVNRKC